MAPFKKKKGKRKTAVQQNTSNKCYRRTQNNCETENIIIECKNCKRQNTNNVDELSFHSVSTSDIQIRKKGKFSFITDVNDGDIFMLCPNCYGYFCKDYNGMTLADSTWPGFIWQLLYNARDESVWSIIPYRWRQWWLKGVQSQIDVLRHVTLNTPECLVVDVTAETEKVVRILKGLVWKDLIDLWDNECCVPRVRCPWGCSEFFHKTNDLPFDQFVKSTLNWHEVSTYSTCNGGWTKGMRRDFCSSKGLILGNPAWPCQPSVVLGEKGPRLLCCRFHDVRSIAHYVHVPRNPTGVISIEGSNQCSPARPVVRMVRPTKAYKYCTSYARSQMTGNFNGADTTWVTDQGKYDGVATDLACRQDALAISGRQDMKEHLKQLLQEKTIPAFFFKDKMDDSTERYGGSILDLKNTFGVGATYVSLKDALEMERVQKEGDIRSIEYYDLYRNRWVSENYVPCWPLPYPVVHPYGDMHGMSPPELPPLVVNGRDSRLFWYLCAMVTTVPEIWREVDAKVVSTRGWYGWLLTFVSKKCFSHATKKASRNNPFKGESLLPKNLNDRLTDEGKQLENCLDVLSFDYLFRDIESILMVSHTFPSLAEISVNHKIIIVLLNSESPGDFTVHPAEGWELRFAGNSTLDSDEENDGHKWTGAAWSRHGGDSHSKWWKQERHLRGGIKGAYKVHGTGVCGIHRAGGRGLNLLVYAQDIPLDFRFMRDEYLEMIGGQAKIYCCLHHKPMILNNKYGVQNSKICCCSEDDILINGAGSDVQCIGKSLYMCSVKRCVACICKAHFQQIQECQQITTTYEVGTQPSHCMFMNAQDNGVVETSNRTNFFDLDSDNESLESLETKLQAYQSDDASASLSTQSVDSDILSVDEGMDRGFLMTSAMEDLVDDMDEEDKLEDNNTFPCTNAGIKPVHEEWGVDTRHNGIINSYVIMNSVGNCLVRRNRNLHFAKKARMWLEKLVVSGKGGTGIPLIYHEGTLHSNVFWMDTKDGEIPGSLTTGLLTDGYNSKKFGFASLMDHVRTRFSDPCLLTSTDYKYQFNTYDALLNIGIRGNNVATILKRGFADEQGNEGIRMKGDEEDIFDTSSVDCRKTVNQLASVLAVHPTDFFLTFTANQRECPGLRIIDNWVKGDAALVHIANGELMSSEDEFKYKQALRDSAASIQLRCWLEFSHMFLRYLQESKESTFGPLKYLFARMEFQGEAMKGILPHWHVLLRLKKEFDRDNPPIEVLDKIRGSIQDMFRANEVEVWLERDWISREEEIHGLRQSAISKTKHHCTTRCQIPQKRKGADGMTVDDMEETKCKAPNNWLLNPSPTEHAFVPILVEREQYSLEVYLKLGMIDDKRNQEGELEFCPSSEWIKLLTAKKHVPPARREDGIISPINPDLFVMMQCVQNLQYTTGFLLSRYLAEYLLQVDKCNSVVFKAADHRQPEGKEDKEGKKGNNVGVAPSGDIQIHGRITGNTKISGVRAREEKKKMEKLKDVGSLFWKCYLRPSNILQC